MRPRLHVVVQLQGQEQGNNLLFSYGAVQCARASMLSFSWEGKKPQGSHWQPEPACNTEEQQATDCAHACCGCCGLRQHLSAGPPLHVPR